MTRKEQNKIKLIEYLGNPENEWLPRYVYATEVLNYSHPRTLYKTFNTDELQQMEAEALQLRRSKYAADLARIDVALLNKAADGDVQAIKLVYQRFENWVPKRRHEVTGQDGVALEVIVKWPQNVEPDKE